MIIKLLRNALGLIIVFFDSVTRPKATKRAQAEQDQAQQNVEGHSLYQLYACPFCVKTRRALHRLNVDLDIRDINKDPKHRADLENGGGCIKVPCLRIEKDGKVEWMYESNDIIQYLEQRVA